MACSAIAAASTALPAAADASPAHSHWIPSARAEVFADGVGYALYVKKPGTVNVLDTKSGTAVERQIDTDCRPRSASAGRALLTCGESSGYPYPVVLNLRTGATARPSGYQSWDHFQDVGSQWIEGAYSVPQGAFVSVFLNWRTSERVEGDIRVQRDLDSKGLAPLTPCGRRQTGRVQFVRPLILGFLRGGLLLTKCQSAKQVVVSTCGNVCDYSQLSRDWVTWTTGRWAYAYSIRTGHRSKWRFPGHDTNTGVRLAAGHTRSKLFVTLVLGGTTPSTYKRRVYEIALK